METDIIIISATLIIAQIWYASNNKFRGNLWTLIALIIFIITLITHK